MRGMQAFRKAKCDQCHQLAGHGLNLGPDLSEVAKRYRGDRLLEQILDPSSEINARYRTFRFLLVSGEVVTGIVTSETDSEVQLMTNLLLPEQLRTLTKEEIELRSESRVSTMPAGLVDTLTKQEIADLLSYLQADGIRLPEHQNSKHNH